MLDNLLDPSSSARRGQVLTALLRTLGTDDEAAAIRVKLNAGCASTLATLTDRPDAALRAALVLAWPLGSASCAGSP